MNYTYYISTARGLVAGFSREHQCVQTTDQRDYAKSFDTSQKAQRWAEKHSDCGYGLTSGKWSIKNRIEL